MDIILNLLILQFVMKNKISKEIKLLPCPFCGAKAGYLRRESTMSQWSGFDIKCTRHGCYLEEGAEWCWENPEDAVLIWNMRS